MEYQQEMAKAFAYIGAAGFAMQRGLEILDPFIIAVMQGIKAVLRFLLRASYSKVVDFFGNPDADAQKAWFLNLISFGIGWGIASNSDTLLRIASDNGVNRLLTALAISTGTNAINSIVKFGQYAKDARKAEVRPLPKISIEPGNPTISLQGGGIRLTAIVTGADDSRVRWEILSLANAGQLTVLDDSIAEYKPAQAGKFHIAAISVANSAARAVVMITVTST